MTTSPSLPQPKAESGTHRPRILLVDDDPQILRVMQQTLTRAMDADLRITSVPEEAARWIRSETFDLILCDLKMPVFDGLTLLRMAKRHNPDALGILITGEADAERLAAVMNADFLWRVLFKPWTPDTLVATLREGLLLLKSRARQKKILKNLALAAEKNKGILKGGAVVARTPRVFAAAHSAGGLKSAPGVHSKPSSIRISAHSPSAGAVAKRVRLLAKGAVAETGWLDKRFRLDRKIKEGGTGEVFQAFDQLLAMPVAIKILSSAFATNPEALASLKREARIAMHLSHSHIVRLHTLDIFHNRPCLIMEYIDGVNLRQWIQAHGTMSAEQLSQVAGICADALAYAHRHGVFHRDLKPDNIMIRRDGVIKLIDFGIAVHVRIESASSNMAEGTPWYMSPEEIQGEPVDGRTDVYSLAATLHELFTGMLPFAAQPADANPLVVREPVFSQALSPAVRHVFQCAMGRKKEDRWEDVASFAAELQRTLAGGEESGLPGNDIVPAMRRVRAGEPVHAK